MSTEQCDRDVYENGTSMGMFAMSKEQAEEYCAAETKRTGYKHDWHFIGGRVHVKALLPKPKDDRIAALEAELAKVKAERDAAVAAWECAKRQNAHDMLLSGDEIHQHDAAIAREVK